MTATLSNPLLSIDMLPGSSWGSNVRSMVRRSTWDRLRKQAYAKAEGVCEICGGVGTRHPLECHEEWIFVFSPTTIQRLLRLLALCPLCHEVKHYGRAVLQGNAQRAEQHLMKVNGWDENTVRLHIARKYAIWKDRNQYTWKVDISMLETLGVDLKAEPKR